MLLLCILAVPLVHAQNIDRERMERDINIMESVLEELFKIEWNSNSSTMQVASGSFSFGGGSEITGTYISNYGIVFTIPSQTSGFIVSTDGDEYNYQFKYENNDNDQKITKETVANRIKYFLRDYGSTIGQLKNEDHITVIYEKNSTNHFVKVLPDNNRQKDPQKFPSTIYVTACASDLQALRRGNISKTQFDDRLTVAINDEKNQRRDLKVMANILKTTFEDVEDDEFRVRGSVKETYIENLGALFYLDVSYGSGFYAFGEAMVAVREKLSKIIDPDSVSIKFENSEGDNRSESELRKAGKQAYQGFLNQLKETLVDYGQTLKSVDSDEQVLISISLSRSGKAIPERVDLQIEKSVLEALDQGSLSREAALNRISVQEY